MRSEMAETVVERVEERQSWPRWQVICQRFPAIPKVSRYGCHQSTIVGRCPDPERPSLNLLHDFVYGVYNNIDDTRTLMDILAPGLLATILVEPMLGSGGCSAGTPGFPQVLQVLATQRRSYWSSTKLWAADSCTRNTVRVLTFTDIWWLWDVRLQKPPTRAPRHVEQSCS